MIYTIPRSHYTVNGKERQITLLSPFDELEVEQIQKIIDVDRGNPIYNANYPGFMFYPISMDGGVITYSNPCDDINNDTNLRITYNSHESI